MTILEITVQRRLGDTWPVVLDRSQVGKLPTRAEGELDLGAGWREKLLTLALDPLAYGTVLGKTLFREAVRDAFVTARNESRGDLRTLLVVEDPELKPLHWERLCAPIRPGNKWGLLGLDQRSAFSLYLPSLADRRFPCPGRKCTSVRQLWEVTPSSAVASSSRGADRPTQGVRQPSHPVPDPLVAPADMVCSAQCLGADARG
jgi:hypothetical protein